MMQICASDPLLLPVAATALLEQGGRRIRERWRQSGRRGPNIPVHKGISAPRNLLGFIDGIVGPHTAAEHQRHLWLAGPAPSSAARSPWYGVWNSTCRGSPRSPSPTRRRSSDGAEPAARPLRRDRSRGPEPRRQNTGRALPRPGRCPRPPGQPQRGRRRPHAPPLLQHRRTHPGLLFISFQNDLRTFTNTLARMDDSDALLRFTTTTASATFLILPGFDQQRPLGAKLFR